MLLNTNRIDCINLGQNIHYFNTKLCYEYSVYDFQETKIFSIIKKINKKIKIFVTYLFLRRN
jgi:hypothetical protein